MAILTNFIRLTTTPQKSTGVKDAAVTKGSPIQQPVHQGSHRKAPSAPTFPSIATPARNKQQLQNISLHKRSHKKNGTSAAQERGRPLHKYDFDFHFPQSSTDSSPKRGQQDDQGRESNVTSVTDLIKQAAGSGSPRKSRSRSPEKPQLIPTSAERKEKRRPTPLDLRDARRYGQVVSQRKGIQAVHIPITPAEALHRRVNEDGSSSVYTDDAPCDGAPTVSPLRIMKRSSTSRQANVLKAYNDWKETKTPFLESTEITVPVRSKSVAGRGEEQVLLPSSVYVPPLTPPNSRGNRGLIKSATTNDLHPDAPTATTDLFTPLTPWLMGRDDQGTRKASKNLFGNHGWLQDTAAVKKAEPQKPTSFFDGIKKVAREIAEKADFKPTRSRTRSVNRVTISIDAREQSLLYCELEFTLSNALDAYIKSQLNGGRLDPNKLKKIADAWTQKGRPRVTGFRYDLETQIDLIALHIHQFRFYGVRQISEVAVMGLLGAMRTNARAMRVKTLCQPDSVIAKHILDSQALLQLVGSADSQQISLAEVSQFFKVILEREKAARELSRGNGRRRESFVKSIPQDQDDQHTQCMPSETVGNQFENSRLENASFVSQRHGN